MKTPYSLFYLLLITCCSFSVSYAQVKDSVKLSVDPPRNEQNKILQKVQYQLPHSANYRLHIQCKQISDKSDSIIVYELYTNLLSLETRIHSFDLELLDKDYKKRFQQSFMDVIFRYNQLPAGHYVTYLSFNTPDSGIVYENNLIWEVDSTLPQHSALRAQINTVLAPQKKLKSLVSKSKAKISDPKSLSGDKLKRTASRLDRKTGKVNGVSIVPQSKNGKSYAGIYYQEWFLGYYELVEGLDMKQKVKDEIDQLRQAPTSLVSTSLTNFNSVSGQIKKIFQSDKEKEGIKGTVDVNGYFSNGQEPGSQQENNYQEYRAAVQTKVKDIPISLEGYYTTQDRHRVAKASYIRLHYDVDEAKSELSEMINSYKGKYNETVSKGKGLEGIYQTFINQLLQQKNGYINSLKQEYGLAVDGNDYTDFDKLISNVDTTGLTDKATGEVDSSGKAKEKYQKLLAKKEEAQKKYEQLKETEKKIEKYQKLLDQYQEQNFFDSTLTYSKLKNLESKEDVSYKDMAKAASELLPKGKVSQFITGLTKLDVGILNAYESNYTMSGQTLKGGTVGYDLGFAKTSAAYGKTEYISRDGSVNRYNTYMGRVDFKPQKDHKVGIIYYGYSPTKNMMTSDNYLHSDAINTGFAQPVHILSLTYSGKVTDALMIQSEGAVSYKKYDEERDISMDNTAIKTSVDYFIPKTSFVLQGEWEHMGKHFENSAMPYIRSGTDRYTLATKATLFKSYLNVGIQFNHLKQSTFSTTGYNTKWGFDVRTKFKRYPNVYLSYKPYSTFRAYDDTMVIAQRPIVGEVWIGRSTYQIKRKKVTHRFMITYNQNTSTMDTQSYDSRTFQAGYTYASIKTMFASNAGWVKYPSIDTGAVQSGSMSSYFINGMINRNVGTRVSINVGQDIAIADFGLQRLATTVGGSYTLKKTPLTIRAQARYSKFKQQENSPDKKIWYGQLGLGWRFNTKR